MNTYTSYSAYRNNLTSGKSTVVETVAHFLRNIEATKDLNAFLEVFADEALERAAVIDAKIKEGTAGKLAGMVISLKDNIAYKGHRFSSSSKILDGFESLFDATVTQRLLAEDAIIIGRTNCDEFAMGSSNENSAFGPVKNPIDPTRVPGGSSGGSAASVAADCCHASIGTDTGGSIRQPAAYCGLVGYKPTYGRVSRHGLIAYASSFDQAGPLTKCVEDAGLILEVISGADEFDATSTRYEVERTSNLQPKKGLKFALLKEVQGMDGLHPEVKAHFDTLVEKFRAAGHTVEEASFPYIEYTIPAYYVLTTAEASSNLSRFAGVTYGYRSLEANDLESTYKKTRSEGFGREVKRRIMLGTFVLSEGYYDAYYGKAQKVRRVLRNDMERILNTFDAVLLPSTPSFPFKFGEKSSNPIEMYLEDIFTAAANLTGNPAISVPTGKSSNGLPIGTQLIGKLYQEKELLEVALEVEQLMN